MYIYCRTIRIQDTDSTGAVYFANLLQIALEAFEEFLRIQGFSVAKMIKKNQFLLPIVHAEGDFLLPLALGDQIEVNLTFPKIGTSSFTHASEIKKQGVLVGKTSIVHVAYSSSQKGAIPIPEDLKKIFT